METVFAAFAVAQVEGGFAATTRAADRGEAGRIGLPGGKVDPGESPEDCARRESGEEGWSLTGSGQLIHDATVEGRRVQWFLFPAATMLREFKEMGRIAPCVATRQQIAGSGYGNEFMAERS